MIAVTHPTCVLAPAQLELSATVSLQILTHYAPDKEGYFFVTFSE